MIISFQASGPFSRLGGQTDFDRAFRKASVHLFSHMQYLRRRGYELEVEKDQAIITRRDQAVTVRVPLETLANPFALSELGF